MRKRVFKMIGSLIVLLILTETFIFSTDYFNKPQKSDAIIVLGCKVNGENPTRFLYERTMLASRLYKEGYSEYIILSGGKGEGENISEAECMRRILINEGIDDEKLILEDKSTNTYENLVNSKKIIEDKNFKDVLIVSNKFHLRRAKLISDKLGLKASFSGIFVKDKWYTEIYGGLREILGLMKDIFK